MLRPGSSRERVDEGDLVVKTARARGLARRVTNGRGARVVVAGHGGSHAGAGGGASGRCRDCEDTGRVRSCTGAAGVTARSANWTGRDVVRPPQRLPIRRPPVRWRKPHPERLGRGRAGDGSVAAPVAAWLGVPGRWAWKSEREPMRRAISGDGRSAAAASSRRRSRSVASTLVSRNGSRVTSSPPGA